MVVLFLLVSGVLMPRAAFAYLDPGTGSLLIQMIIGAIAGSLYMLKSYWHEAKSFVKNIFVRNATDETDEN